MIKIDDSKSFSTQSASNKPAGDNSPNNPGNADDENFDHTDFATVMENLAKREKTSPKERETEAKQSAKPRTEKEDSKSKADSNGLAGWRATNEQVTVETETALPPARSILHVADLERIVSSIRTNQFEGGQQITIALKNSVLNGLQIRLTSDDKGRIAAQFLVADERIKTQIEGRAGELADLLKRRGVQLTNLQTSLDAGTSGNGGSNQTAEAFGVLTSETAVLASEPETEEFVTNETHENIYRA